MDGLLVNFYLLALISVLSFYLFFQRAGLCQGQFKMVVVTLEYFRYNQNCVFEMHSSKKKSKIETLGGKKKNHDPEQQNTCTEVITLLSLEVSSSGIKADTVAILQPLSVCFLPLVCRNDSVQQREAFYLKRPRISRSQYGNSEAVCFNLAKRRGHIYFLAQSYVNSSILCLNIVSRDVCRLEILQIYNVDLLYY